MTTAIDIIEEATATVSEKLGYKVNFYAGTTQSVINYVERLKSNMDIYPAVIVFRDGMIEETTIYGVKFTIPKIAICCYTDLNLTEKERRAVKYDTIIYPVFEELEKQLKLLDYSAVIQRIDIPFVNENRYNTFYDLVDGCIIKNLKMNVEVLTC